jgi:hypothetical protein
MSAAAEEAFPHTNATRKAFLPQSMIEGKIT